jgi:hypothetical protein
LQVIGGEDMYKPLCRECFNEETITKELILAQDMEESTALKRKLADPTTSQDSEMTSAAGHDSQAAIAVEQ